MLGFGRCYLMSARHEILCNIHRNLTGTRLRLRKKPSSETQGRSVGPEEKARRKFLSTGGKAPGYRLSPDHFQKVKRMLAPDWAQKKLCIILPNRQTVSPEFFSWVRTRRLLSRSRLVWLMQQRNARSLETFSLIKNLHLISKYCLPEN